MAFKILGPKGHVIVRSVKAAGVARRLPALIRRFKRVTVTTAPTPPDYRARVVRWARWGVANEPSIHYRETRPMPLHTTLPLTTDCSGFATLCYFNAGAPDPNGLGYSGQGFTGTLLAHGRHVTKTQARPGDLVVYGKAPGIHVAIIVASGSDPLTASHGKERGPELIRVSQDGRQPQTFISYLP